jgi:hypothetical protein
MAAMLRRIIRDRFGDEHFSSASVSHAVDHLRPWPLDSLTQTALMALGDCPLDATELLAERLGMLRRYYWYLMAGYPDTSFACISELPDSAGAPLVRGLAIAEEHGFCRYRGSVSLVCHAFRAFQQKGVAVWTPLADWLVQHSTNPWVPFNMRRTRWEWEACRFPGRSPIEVWYAAYELSAGRDQARRERELEEEAARTARRIAYQKRHAELMAIRLERRELRAAILIQFQNLSAVEKLARIADDREHPVTFYPSEFATIDPTSLSALPHTVRQSLIERLSDRRKGAWRRLREQLEQDSSP